MQARQDSAQTHAFLDLDTKTVWHDRHILLELKNDKTLKDPKDAFLMENLSDDDGIIHTSGCTIIPENATGKMSFEELKAFSDWHMDPHTHLTRFTGSFFDLALAPSWRRDRS